MRRKLNVKISQNERALHKYTVGEQEQVVVAFETYAGNVQQEAIEANLAMTDLQQSYQGARAEIKSRY